MSKPMKPKSKWLPMESNPEVMNKCLANLGVPPTWGVSDVVSLEEELMHMIPVPSLALLLLFPITPKYLAYCEKQEEEQKARKEREEELDGIYYMKQTVKNGCGTIALIHAIANNEERLQLVPGSVLQRFIEETRSFSPLEKGKFLEQNLEIGAEHEASAQQGQTGTPNLDDDVNLHFIALINANGNLVELDGRKFGPIVHGKTNDETFVRDSLRVCKEYMRRDPESVNFTALSFGIL